MTEKPKPLKRKTRHMNRAQIAEQSQLFETATPVKRFKKGARVAYKSTDWREPK